MQSKNYSIKKHLLLAYLDLYPDVGFDGLIIKVNREALKMSLREFGSYIGESHNAIFQWENSKRGLYDVTKSRLIDKLNISPNEFSKAYWDI